MRCTLAGRSILTNEAMSDASPSVIPGLIRHNIEWISRPGYLCLRPVGAKELIPKHYDVFNQNHCLNPFTLFNLRLKQPGFITD
jgi:hypothetical protein